VQIIDAQIHLWAAGLPSNPTHWPVTHFTAEEAIALMDEGGVDGAVIHPPAWDPGATEFRGYEDGGQRYIGDRWQNTLHLQFLPLVW